LFFSFFLALSPFLRRQTDFFSNKMLKMGFQQNVEMVAVFFEQNVENGLSTK